MRTRLWHAAASRRHWLIIAVTAGVASVLGIGVPVASAGLPIAGARYAFSTTLSTGDWARVSLTLANDGREMAQRSHVSVIRVCAKYTLADGFALDGSDNVGSHAVSIYRGGRFAHRTRVSGRIHYSIAGSFSRRGRLAVGRVRMVRDGSCPRVDFRFRARLVGVPNAPVPGKWAACDRVISDEVSIPGTNGSASITERYYDMFERGAGCTTARDVARRWNATKRCVRAPVGFACAIVGATCARIDGGVADPLAGTRCRLARRPSAAVELVRFEPCQPPATNAMRAQAWAINLDCAPVTNYPVESLFPDELGHGPCGPLQLTATFTCSSIAGYSCHGEVTRPGARYVLTAQCTADADGARAFRIELRY
jgi:hypothetical protein